MERFYGGKKCVTEQKMTGVKWAHLLDAALTTSNPRVSQTIIESYGADDTNSFQRCWHAICVKIATPAMLVKFEKILYYVHLSFFLCQLVS